MSTFADFNLTPELLKALTRMKYEVPTPIQEKAIPLAMAGRDLIASAQTGTGKTAAFGIPLISHLLKNPTQRALVLAPTRELADQILLVLKELAFTSRGLNAVLLIGGDSMFRQLQGLKANPRIIVATPGRLVDHLRRNKRLLDGVKMLVLDEADRMLDLGFEAQLDVIRGVLPKERQTLLFSATFPPSIAQLGRDWLQNPERVSAVPIETPLAQITEAMIETTSQGKSVTLIEELQKREGSVLIFVRTKRRVDHLSMFLKEKGISTCRIHGDRSQGQRQEALLGFRKGKFRVLVATDIAARGIDVPHIEHVINYDVPLAAEEYVHRIGRTGRAGRLGQALCLVSPEEKSLWRAIERLRGKGGKGSADGRSEYRPYRGRSGGSGGGRSRGYYGGGGAGRGRSSGGSGFGGGRSFSDRSSDRGSSSRSSATGSSAAGNSSSGSAGSYR